VPQRYKFIELSVVTDETLERAVNEWVSQDWTLEAIRFVTTEHSKRPAMAFVSFTREATQDEATQHEATQAGAGGEPSAAPKVLVAGDNDVE
jgi:hypothetical protein